MPNDAKTMLARRAVALGQFSRFSLPPFPELPAKFVSRFPELATFNDDVKRWLSNLNSALEKTLSTPKPD